MPVVIIAHVVAVPVYGVSEVKVFADQTFFGQLIFRDDMVFISVRAMEIKRSRIGQGERIPLLLFEKRLERVTVMGKGGVDLIFYIR